MFKVYIRGNYFIVEDTVTNVEYEGLAKDVFIRRLATDSTEFAISNLNGWNATRLVNITELVDENNVGFTLQSFIDFYSVETGFNGGKRPPTTTEITYAGGSQVFDLDSENVKQVFVNGVLTNQFTITGLTIDFGTALNINDLIQIYYEA